MFNRLMIALTVQRKILVLLVLFAIPLTILGLATIRDARKVLEQATSERRGAEEIGRLLTAAILTRDPTVMERARGEILKVADDSMLSLDPDLDSYHVQLALTAEIPGIAVVVFGDTRKVAEFDSREARGAAVSTLLLPRLDHALREALDSDPLTLGVSPSLQSWVRDYDAQRSQFEQVLLEAVRSTGSQSTEMRTAAIALHELSTRATDELLLLLDKRVAVLEADVTRLVALSGASAVLLVFFSWYVVQNLTHRLLLVSQAAERASERGDLTHSVEESGRDEVSLLSRSFNRMVGTIRRMVENILRSGSIISTSVSEIAAVSRQQQATSSEIAATTAQIEATSKRIASTSEDLSKSMKNVLEAASETAELAVDGQTSVERMRQTIHGVTDASTGISQKLEILTQRASRIGDVVTTIAKVADQTNLLSLNAAIEAEKAGEFGHGFSVVAREIRRLADQTALSTIDIEQMVKEIQSAVAAGVMGMERFASEVTRGAHDVETASVQLSTIIQRIQNLSPTFLTVTEGMQLQAMSARQITESLSQLSNAARQSADSLTQSNLSIEQLHDATTILHEEVRRFRIVEEA